MRLTPTLRKSAVVAKPIPKKKAVAKKRRKDETQITHDPQKLTKRAEKALKELQDRVEERYEYASEILKLQSDAVANAVDKMRAKMEAMAGPPKFTYDGMTYAEDKRFYEIQRKSHVWIAVRLLVACAEWDIRIGDFKLPKGECARCGATVKLKKKGKR